MELHELTQKARDLAPLQPTTVRLAAVLSDPESAIDDIVEVIQYDQAVTAEVLRSANAAHSAANREICDIRDAVIRMGGARILARLVGGHIRKTCQVALPAFGYSENELWRHSVASAAASEIIGGLLPRQVPPGVFTAALLHDIGKLLMARFAPESECGKIWETVRERECSCEQAERIVFGFSHADIGAEIISEWRLPLEVSEAIRYHHRPTMTDSIMMDCVVLSNTVARCIGVGLGFEGMGFVVDENLAGRLELTRERFERICAHTVERYANILMQFERGTGSPENG